MDQTRPVRPWHALTAVVTWAALLLQLVLVIRGGVGLDEVTPPALGRRLVRFISYFTVLTNLLVAFTATTLALRQDRFPTWWKVVQLNAVVGIAVTGLVHWFRLRPLLDLSGADDVADKLLHVGYPRALLACVGVAVLLLALTEGAIRWDRRLRGGQPDPFGSGRGPTGDRLSSFAGRPSGTTGRSGGQEPCREAATLQSARGDFGRGLHAPPRLAPRQSRRADRGPGSGHRHDRGRPRVLQRQPLRPGQPQGRDAVQHLVHARRGRRDRGDIETGLITPEQAACITGAYAATEAPASFTIKVVGGKDGLLAGGVTNQEILMNGKSIDHSFVAYGDAIFGSYASCGVEC